MHKSESSPHNMDILAVFQFGSNFPIRLAHDTWEESWMRQHFPSIRCIRQREEMSPHTAVTRKQFVLTWNGSVYIWHTYPCFLLAHPSANILRCLNTQIHPSAMHHVPMHAGTVVYPIIVCVYIIPVWIHNITPPLCDGKRQYNGKC